MNYSQIPTSLHGFMENPFRVFNENHFVVTNDGDDLDVAAIIAYAQKFNGTLIHLGGGCKGLPEGGEEKMLLFFLNILDGSNKGLCSGGTTDEDSNGNRKIMITEIPPAVSLLQGNATFASFPRVEKFRFKGEGNLVTSQWDTAVNTNYGLNIAVQKSPFADFVDGNGDSDWAGDLRKRFKVYELLRQNGINIVFIGFNGGAVTRDEMLLGLQAGYPTFLIDGSGRETQNLIDQYRTLYSDADQFREVFGVTPEEETLMFLPFDDAMRSREILAEQTDIYNS